MRVSEPNGVSVAEFSSIRISTTPPPKFHIPVRHGEGFGRFAAKFGETSANILEIRGALRLLDAYPSMRWHTPVFDLLSVGWVDFAVEQNLREVHKRTFSERLADGLTFEFELFDLPYSAPDPRLGHWR